MGEKLTIQRSALHHHKLFKKQLIPPFNQLSPQMTQVFWVRDLLPEFLWIDSLFQRYGEPSALSVFNDFLSALDPLLSDSRDVVDGTVSAFSLVPEELRGDFLRTYAGKIQFAVKDPISPILSLYPECPMRWLLPNLERADEAESIARSTVVRLFPGKDDYCSRLRVFPIVRHFAHGKIKITSNLKELIEAIRQYPKGDRAHVESFARGVYNTIVSERAQKHPSVADWPKYFWRRNAEIVACRETSS